LATSAHHCRVITREYRKGNYLKRIQSMRCYFSLINSYNHDSTELWKSTNQWSLRVLPERWIATINSQ